MAVSFRLSEDEVNQYLVFALLKAPRPGIASIALKFFPNDYVSTLTVIDFDEIERWSPGLVCRRSGPQRETCDLDRFALFSRQRNRKLQDREGLLSRQDLASLSAEKIVQTLGARQPEGFGGDQDIVLPLGLRRIQPVSDRSKRRIETRRRDRPAPATSSGAFRYDRVIARPIDQVVQYSGCAICFSIETEAGGEWMERPYLDARKAARLDKESQKFRR